MSERKTIAEEIAQLITDAYYEAHTLSQLDALVAKADKILEQQPENKAQRFVSTCCNYGWWVKGETTRYHVCAKCKQACDIKPQGLFTLEQVEAIAREAILNCNWQQDYESDSYPVFNDEWFAKITKEIGG